jgi:hypothetical protein
MATLHEVPVSKSTAVIVLFKFSLAWRDSFVHLLSMKGKVHSPGRMASSGMLRRVALVITEVSKELSASFIRVTRIGERGTTLAVRYAASVASYS